jgi:hypothetical protein
MFFFLLALTFPAWRPHFSFLENPVANEMMALRWLHLIFGIIWIGLLYFFNLVLTPAMKQVEPAARVKVYPALMSKAMAWFRSSALVAVGLGCRLHFYLRVSAPYKRICRQCLGARHRHHDCCGRGVVARDGVERRSDRFQCAPGNQRWRRTRSRHVAEHVGRGLAGAEKID